ncbi:DNA internalization-related competence protein ComEC/Rec2 [Nitrococcus mobilis]|uniref:DNA internalization-related competence protein ComEC/Rec2 n=1 Tax=Nitrococcus mobilis Nb-231 TaxID=314278 RepID=A4BMK5_9GAMM|nr:DNA internalization-related competence protein ComEC/Rec2 [Nitrococcus mobilis]EAR23543.1 DNA internalization-related competence protein ComEC/Rec2 [Nitrococcus mobilis Nb-231]
MAAFAIGVIGFQLLPWPLAGWLALATLPLLALLLARTRARQLGLFTLGVAWAAAAAAWALECRLPNALDGRNLILEGVVIELPERTAVRQRFLVRPIRIVDYPANRPLPRRIRLAWYGRTPTVHPGERWRWRVKLRQPHGLMNPTGFDYERWLFQNRIDATGYVRNTLQARRLDTAWSVDALRERISRGIATALEGQGAAAGVLTALVTGDRRGIDPATWRDLNAAGITHLIAISGLHIGLVAGLVYWLTGGLWRRLPQVPLWLPTPIAQTVTGTLAAMGYATLAGFSVPTQRALIMLMVLASARLARRRIGPLRAWWGAMAAVLALDPFAPLGPGFWLSFTAVAVILLVVRRRPGVSRRQELIGLQFALAVGLLPIMSAWFQRCSLIAPFINLAAIPLAGMLLVPGALLATAALWLLPGLGSLLLQGLAWLTQSLLAGLGHLVHAVQPLVLLPTPEFWTLALAAVGATLLLLPAGFPGRVLAVPLCVPLLVGVRASPSPGTAWITVLDVGQGSSVVVRTARHILVYDTGPAWGGGNAAAASVSLLPFLRSRGITVVDRVVVSHADDDHSGGLAALLAALPAANVVIGEPFATAPSGARLCQRGQAWQWDEVRFRVLAPRGRGLRGNDASCVIRVASAGAALLLPGDLERAGELELLEQPGSLSADVLLVPHHGSRTSSSAEFIRRVQPSLALVSVGRNNSYGLPAAEVINRYRRHGVRVLRTDRDGAIQLALGVDGYRVRARLRRDRQAYYHMQP